MFKWFLYVENSNKSLASFNTKNSCRVWKNKINIICTLRDNFRFWRVTCSFPFTLYIPWSILTKLGIQLVFGNVYSPIYFRGYRSKVKVKLRLTFSSHVQPCKYSTLDIILLILTILFQNVGVLGIWACSLRFFN